MNDPAPTDLEKNLQELSRGYFPFERQEAARKLGELPTTNQQIIEALAIATEFDKDAEVRRIASEALQATVHQAFIKDHPGIVQNAIEAAERNRVEEQRNEQTKIKAEFLHRRNRVRRLTIILVIGIFIWYGLFTLGVILATSVMENWLCAFQISILLFVGAMIWQSWRIWRCPACDVWLGGWAVQINPIWPMDSLQCPHCGARLL